MTSFLSQSATESDVGITHFLTDTDPFEGVLRSRYSDFIVEELFNDTPVSMFPLPHVDKSTSVVDYSKFEAICGPVAASEARSYCESVLSGSPTSEFIILSPSPAEIAHFNDQAPLLEKEHRRSLHNAVRSFLPDCVASDTINDIDFTTNTGTVIKRKAVRLFPTSSQKQSSKNKRLKFDKRSASWPTDRPPYTRFTLAKENIDTLNAIKLISKILSVSPKIFKTSGLKDRRAVTLQHVTAFKLPKDKLIKANSIKTLRVSDFRYVSEELRLGKHSGNRFTLTLRELQGDSLEETVTNAVDQVKNRGFLNYFGLQRFGATVLQTHRLGELLLKGEYLGLIKYILSTPSMDDSDDVLPIRQYFKDVVTLDLEFEERKREFLQVFKKATKRYETEIKILSKLVDSATDLQSAVSSIGSQLLKLYTHAYQSYIFNILASKRISLHGMSPVPGDLVYANPSPYNDLSEEAELDDDVNRISVVPRVKTLTEHDVKDYTIFDIILPLVGTETVMPEFLQCHVDHLTDVLSSESPSRSFPHLVPRGGYRKVVAKPVVHSACLRSYTNPTDVLVDTPLNVFKREMGEKCEELAKDEGNLNALVVSFDLSPSSYATMFVRELTKQSSHRYQHAMVEQQRRKERHGDGDVPVKRTNVE
ncbi:hypothetical protein P9112_014653 [Eukaryota sp. TZLM1-RC]